MLIFILWYSFRVINNGTFNVTRDLLDPSILLRRLVSFTRNRVSHLNTTVRNVRDLSLNHSDAFGDRANTQTQSASSAVVSDSRDVSLGIEFDCLLSKVLISTLYIIISYGNYLVARVVTGHVAFTAVNAHF
jgi:hypothetical protein